MLQSRSQERHPRLARRALRLTLLLLAGLPEHLLKWVAAAAAAAERPLKLLEDPAGLLFRQRAGVLPLGTPAREAAGRAAVTEARTAATTLVGEGIVRLGDVLELALRLLLVVRVAARRAR